MHKTHLIMETIPPEFKWHWKVFSKELSKCYPPARNPDMSSFLDSYHHHLVFRSAPAQLVALLSAMPETVEELNAYLAAHYSHPRDEDIPSSSRSAPAFALAGLEPSPEWEEATRAYHAQLSAEPTITSVPSTFVPTPSPTPGVPTHPA